MNTVFVLILFAHGSSQIGMMGAGNSNALTTAEFNSAASCAVAGAQAKKLAQGTVKVIDFVCVQK